MEEDEEQVFADPFEMQQSIMFDNNDFEQGFAEQTETSEDNSNNLCQSEEVPFLESKFVMSTVFEDDKGQFELEQDESAFEKLPEDELINGQFFYEQAKLQEELERAIKLEIVS